jgi:hypothetical protein
LHYHRKLNSFIGYTTGQELSSPLNIFVYSQNGAHSSFYLKYNYAVANVIYVVGDYGNGFIAICQPAKQFTDFAFRAFAIDLDGRNRRQLFLPYDELRKNLVHGKFQYLRIAVCEGVVLLEHTYLVHSKARNKGFGAMASMFNLYRIGDEGFALKLIFLKALHKVTYVYTMRKFEDWRGTAVLRNPVFDTECNLFMFTYQPFRITILEMNTSYNTTKLVVLNDESFERVNSAEVVHMLGPNAIGIEGFKFRRTKHLNTGDHLVLNVFLVKFEPCVVGVDKYISDEKWIGRPTLVIQVFTRNYTIIAVDENRLIAWPSFNFRKGDSGTLAAQVYLQQR